MSIPPPRALAAGLLAAPLVLGGCDNVGRAWDPGRRGTTPSAATQFQLPPEGGVTRSASPKVLLAAPTGSGLPPTTPIIVWFDQSMNLDSLRTNTATEGKDPTHLYLRVQRVATGTDDETTITPIAAAYELLRGGRLLVMRPQAALQPAQTYEIVAGNEVKDIDKQRLQKIGVLAEFTADGTPEAGLRVLATIPPNNERDWMRPDPVFVALTGPVDPQTVTTDSLFVQTTDRVKVAGEITTPITTQNVPDPRFFGYEPDNPFAGDTRFQIRITDAIKAGEIELDVGTRDPFASFTTGGALPADDARVGNPTTGFDNRVNIANIQGLTIAVDVPQATLAGDTLTVRLYGNDSRETSDTLLFVEKSATVATPGQGTTTVSFANELGVPGAARFKDGSLTIACELSRGTAPTGYVLATDAAQDTTRPTLASLGPPSATGDVYLTDLSSASLHGSASERIGRLTLTVGTQTFGLFASGEGGRFMSLPFVLNRTTAPTPFTLTMQDAAGNDTVAAATGTIVQRGLLTGDVTGGTLNVVVYDDASLQVVPGATVLIEPGMPQKPAAGRQSAVTGAAGQVSFTGLTAPRYSITIVAAGYHLASFLDTAASFASLPIRPVAAATATLGGVAQFAAGATSAARIGVNVLDDASRDSFRQTSSGSATTIANVAVRPNRPLMLTAFAGTMPPATKPTFSFSASESGAASAGRARVQPPPAPQAGGAAYSFNMVLLPSLNQFVHLGAAFARDFSGATGLDTANLDGNPAVSIVGSLSGFPGMSYFGPGFASGSGASWTIDGSYSLTMPLDFGALAPVLWVSVQAEDTFGNLSRNRSLISDPISGAVLPLIAPPGVPSVTAPAGTFTGSPLVQVADRLAATAFPNGVAFRTITAVDSGARRWRVFYEDRDAASGTDDVQLPDLAGTGLTGLAPGAWSVRCEDRLVIGPGLSGAEVNFEELLRLELNYARSAAVVHNVQ